MAFFPTAQLVADLKRREGFSLKVYADSKGLATQGIGRHHGIEFGQPDITETIAVRWLAEDLASADNDARSLLGEAYDDMDQIRREALIDLSFNMGLKTLSVFGPFLAHMRYHDYASAAYHLGRNLAGRLTPYVQQVGARAIDNIVRIASGIIPPEHRA